MLVAPPGHLKTTASEVLSEFPRTLIISNVTVKSLTAMRDELLAGNIRTVIFSDYANIHRRHSSISQNIEGVIMGLVGEGFRKAAYSDQRVQALAARATVIGSMTPKFAERMEPEWIDSGFFRRFIWCRYSMNHPEQLEQAIMQWKKAEIESGFSARVPTSGIKYTLTTEEQSVIERSLRRVPGDRKLPLILAQKIMCVLKWKFEQRDTGKAIKLWREFSQSVQPDGAILTIGEKFRQDQARS